MSELTRPSITAVYDYYGLKILGRGSGWSKAECPRLDHQDANPSASINEELGKWTCFSCGNSGDSYDILLEREPSLARLSDARAFAAANIAGGGGTVRTERGSSGGLSVRPASRKGARNWSPPWSGL